MGRPAPVHHLSTATPSYGSASERVGLLAAGDDLTFEPLTFLQIVNTCIGRFALPPRPQSSLPKP